MGVLLLDISAEQIVGAKKFGNSIYYLIEDETEIKSNAYFSVDFMTLNSSNQIDYHPFINFGNTQQFSINSGIFLGSVV